MITTYERRTETQLKTWLTAVEIPFVDGPFRAMDKGGHLVPLILAKNTPDVNDGIVVSGITGRDLTRSLKAFGELQRNLGYLPKVPVDRGAAPEHQASYEDEFDLVAFRHSEFRRSPNPPPRALEAYRTVIEKSVWKFLRSNSHLCQDNMLSTDDLRTYAQVWTCNYIALYEVTNPSQDEKERYLAQFLGQRFSEFKKLWDKKARHMFPSLDDAFIGTHGGVPYDYGNKSNWTTTLTSVEEPTALKQGPIQSLDSQLESLGHDRMVEALLGAANNNRIHPDARAEASRRLRTHTNACSRCATVDVPHVHGERAVIAPVVDESGTVYPTPQDAAKALGLWASNVKAVLRGKYKSTGGHVFKYAPQGLVAA